MSSFAKSRKCAAFLGALVIFLMLGTYGRPVQARKASDASRAKKAEEENGLPLKPVRKVSFITEEASWLSLDVAPDGTTLVLEVLGDLYTLPITGGEARPLTRGMAFDSQPCYSPDGRWIAFISDRDGAENLWIMKPDGSEPRKLSKDTRAYFASPAWTPDGEYVIVSRSTWGLATFELWMYHIQGGSGVRITKAKTRADEPRNRRHNALGVTVSPDGRYLYYAYKRGGFAYNVNFPLWQIARRDRMTGDEDVLTRAQGSAIRPLLSPDGTLLVYGTRFDGETGLRVRNLKTGEDRWLLYPIQRDDQESRFTRDLLPGYAFMPDGKELVLSFGGRIWRVDVATGARQEIPFRVKVDQDVGPNLYFPHRVDQGPVRARIVQDPVLSPDGRRLAFSALTRLYVMDLKRGRPRQISPPGTRAFQPTWSPDGRWLAYVTWSAQGGHIWKIRADGKEPPVRLTRVTAFYADPVWSPDGTRIVALRGVAHERIQRPVDFGPVPGMDLVWVPAEGGEARLIAPSHGYGKPHFGADPGRIYVYTGQILISMRLNGTDRREHIKVEGTGSYFSERPVPAEDLRMRPDGRWVLAHVQNQLYLVAVPQVGGKAPTVNVNKPAVPVKKLTQVGADYFGWTRDGASMVWAVGSSVFRKSFASVKFEPPKKKGEQKEKKADQQELKVPSDAETAEEIPVVLEFPRHRPRGVIVFRGGRLITMRGEEVLEDADLVIRDNRIVALGPRGQVDIPQGAHIMDITGMTVVPGFIDTHAHWFEIRRGILDVQNWSFLANLAYGVTTGLDVQTATNDMFAYQDLVDIGEILGPRAYSTGPGIFSNNDFKSLEQVLGVLARYQRYYRTSHIKSYVVGNRRQRQWVVMAAQRLHMMPTTEGALDLKLDLTHAIDGFRGNEHSLPIVPLYKDVVEFIARTGIGYTPTLLVAYGGPWAENDFYTHMEVHGDPKLNRFMPHNVLDGKSLRRPWFHKIEHVYPKIAAQAAKIMRASGRVGIGSHGQLQGLGYHWEMWALASGGLTPMEVLRCATLTGAEMLGLAQDLGSLEEGKLADFLVLEKNPLDNIRNTLALRYVVKNGEVFDADTLDRVWPEPKKLPHMYWWDMNPPQPGEH